MQLKMRENSLFAVLLRSPWWYSLGIAALLLMVGHLLLRGHYQVIGIALGLPFVVIAAIARYRQSQTPDTRPLHHPAAWVREERREEQPRAAGGDCVGKWLLVHREGHKRSFRILGGAL